MDPVEIRRRTSSPVEQKTATDQGGGRSPTIQRQLRRALDKLLGRLLRLKEGPRVDQAAGPRAGRLAGAHRLSPLNIRGVCSIGAVPRWSATLGAKAGIWESGQGSQVASDGPKVSVFTGSHWSHRREGPRRPWRPGSWADSLAFPRDDIEIVHGADTGRVGAVRHGHIRQGRSAFGGRTANRDVARQRSREEGAEDRGPSPRGETEGTWE